MTKEEIIKFMNENLACHLSTAENNQPHDNKIISQSD